ncbi:MAG: glycosyltransferase family 39 protein [Acidobacteriota bacterium]|nr:glycosyltransferase family 39 protein [Acidobacteriota bacterium]
MNTTLESPSSTGSRGSVRFPLRLGSAALSVLSNTVEKAPAAWLTVLTLIYFATSRLRAGKPLWFDELTTYYLARMDSIAAAWRATIDGVDLQPPLMMALAHISQKLLGPTDFATRLPSIVGVFLACAFLYAFLKKRLGQSYAISGAVLLLLTSAYHYAVEARPYGLVLAGASIALYSWQRACESGRSWLSLTGIALGLWIALASQCYAVLLCVPFGTGEIVRSFRRKKMDWGVWMAFALSATALVFYPPLISLHGNGFAGKVEIFAPNLRSFWIVPSHLFGGGWRVIAVLLVMSALMVRGKSRTVESEPAIPLHETVAIGLLTALPILLTILVAKLDSSIFYRYGIAAVLGMVVLTMRAFHRISFGDPRIGSLILLLMSGVFVERFISDAFSRPDMQPGASIVAGAAETGIHVGGHRLLSFVKPGVPLVVSNPFWFPEVVHYAPRSLADRTFYLRDVNSAKRISGTDFFEYAIPALYKLPVPGHIVAYSDFTATYRHFYLYTSSNSFDWLTGRLGEDGVVFTFVGRLEDALLLEATFPGR